MEFVIHDAIRLTPFTAEDGPALVDCLNNREIYRNTLRIPFPYTLEDADAWIERQQTRAKNGETLTDWAIRSEGKLIGGCGFVEYSAAQRQGQIGYWLAEPYWGRGFMTAVVARLCQHGFAELGVKEITADVFDFNRRSARVLEKNGFWLQERIPRCHEKDGVWIDVLRFVLTATAAVENRGAAQR